MGIESLLKYSPDQPRDDHGRFAAGSGEDMRAPVDQRFNEITTAMADRFFPNGFSVSDTAPNTYEDLVKSYAESGGHMTVWSGASDKTIFGADTKANYAFRAWHDLCHLRIGAHFTPEGEHRVAEEQSKDVYGMLGHNAESDRIVGLIHAEIDGQVGYTQNHGGEFPANQRAFDTAWLKDPEAAVKGDYSKAKKALDATNDNGWGRFRDVYAGTGDAPLSDAAKALSTRLNIDHAIIRAGVGALKLAKYSPDQARDEKGRFASGGGATFVSPNDGELDLKGAVAALSGERQAVFMDASRDIDARLGIQGEEIPVVGAWADGAENSAMLISHGADYESLRVSAAMKGAIGDQKAVLVFRAGAGNARLYEGVAKGSIEDIHDGLMKAGIENHTLSPIEGGAKVYIADLDGSIRQNVGDYAVSQGTTFDGRPGRGEFIGATDYSGSDADQRASAHAAYQGVIDTARLPATPGDPRPSAGRIWADVRDRWSPALAAARKAIIDQLHKAAAGGLYISRNLMPDSAAAFQAWATSQGYTGLPPADDLHATIVYSRAPVDLEPIGGTILVSGGARSVAQFGDATVLTIESPELTARWQEAIDAGATWDHPAYQPHVTITYDGAAVEASAPYEGDLEFGPERHAPIRAGKVVWREMRKAAEDDEDEDDSPDGTGDDVDTEDELDEGNQGFGDEEEEEAFSVERQIAQTAQEELSRRLEQILHNARADVLAALPAVMTQADADKIAEEVAAKIDLSGLYDEFVDEGQLRKLILGLIKDSATKAIAQIGADLESDIVDQVNTDALDYMVARGAELVGKRVTEDGDVVDNPNPAWSITQTTRDAVRNTLAQGIADNIGRPAIQQALEELYAFSPARAKTISKTEIAMANAAGKLQGWRIGARASNHEWMKNWQITNDDNCCDECQANADQGPIPLDEDFESGDDAEPAHPNCYLPDTLVAGEFLAGSKAFYEGSVREIVLRSGARLTVTPNHPILSGRGWVAAAMLQVGDEAISYRPFIEGASDTTRAAGSDKYHRPSPIHEVFDAVRQAGASRRTEAVPHDFHGDAIGFYGDVEIVAVDRHLLADREPASSQLSGEPMLELADVDMGRLVRDGASRKPIAGNADTANGRVCGGREVRPILGSHISPPRTLTVGIAPDLDASRLEPIGQNFAADLRFLRESLKGNPALVSVDEVVEVRDFQFCGHVYDLQSTTGWMIAGGIIASNCQCVTYLTMADDQGDDDE